MYYSTEVKEAAKRLFLRRCKAKEIQAQLNLPNIRIVYYWIRQGGWEDMLSDEEPLTAVGRRITLLLDKASSLTKDELNELDRLTTVRERLLKQAVKPTPAPIGESASEPQERRPGQRGERSSRGDGGGKKREKKVKNDVSELTEVDFLDKFISKMYRYQQELFAAKQNPLTCRIRNILKSRQVGLTYYFAGEAFMDAVLTGDNQVFLSASRSQSEIFRSYILQFAKLWFDIELTGNPIALSNGAELRFLSTNSSTAQGYHGHVYVDEYFWIRDFEKLSTVASAMGTHKKWRKTYFSTPSAVSHQAYLRVERISKNHAQLLSLLDCLRLVLKLSDPQVAATQRQIVRMAIERQASISSDHSAVAEFWEVYDYLESLSEDPVVDHSSDPTVIAINLNEFCERAAEHKQKLADVATLRDLLKESRSRKFLDSNKAVHSAVRAAFNTRNPCSQPRPTTVKCWTFKA